MSLHAYVIKNLLSWTTHIKLVIHHFVVELKANDLDGFKGFLCQMRSQWDQFITHGTLAPLGSLLTNNNCETVSNITIKYQ